MRKFDKAGMFMDNLVSEGKVAGCSVKVVLENKVVYEHYTGYADLKDQIPIEETTLFRIYSMTKPVTVTAALQLYEQGKFLLNDPVAEYLPEFKEMQVCIPDQKGGYKLVPAKRAHTRNAIKLLEIIGFSKEIIRKADDMAGAFLRTGEWKAI